MMRRKDPTDNKKKEKKEKKTKKESRAVRMLKNVFKKGEEQSLEPVPEKRMSLESESHDSYATTRSSWTTVETERTEKTSLSKSTEFTEEDKRSTHSRISGRSARSSKIGNTSSISAMPNHVEEDLIRTTAMLNTIVQIKLGALSDLEPVDQERTNLGKIKKDCDAALQKEVTKLKKIPLVPTLDEDLEAKFAILANIKALEKELLLAEQNWGLKNKAYIEVKEKVSTQSKELARGFLDNSKFVDDKPEENLIKQFKQLVYQYSKTLDPKQEVNLPENISQQFLLQLFRVYPGALEDCLPMPGILSVLKSDPKKWSLFYKDLSPEHKFFIDHFNNQNFLSMEVKSTMLKMSEWSKKESTSSAKKKTEIIISNETVFRNLTQVSSKIIQTMHTRQCDQLKEKISKSTDILLQKKLERLEKTTSFTPETIEKLWDNYLRIYKNNEEALRNAILTLTKEQFEEISTDYLNSKKNIFALIVLLLNHLETEKKKLSFADLEIKFTDNQKKVFKKLGKKGQAEIRKHFEEIFNIVQDLENTLKMLQVELSKPSLEMITIGNIKRMRAQNLVSFSLFLCKKHPEAPISKLPIELIEHISEIAQPGSTRLNQEEDEVTSPTRQTKNC